MRTDLIILAVIVGIGTYLFRLLPTRFGARMPGGDGIWSRFIGATGPAAIATLFIASILPLVQAQALSLVCTLIGSAMVLAAYFWRRNVVLATLAGAAAYGLTYQLLMGPLGAT
jgi:branched-subunit amino acid transport protein AzlD